MVRIVESKSLKESARKTVFEVHIDLGFQERVEKYDEISDAIERVSKLGELLKKPSMSGMKVILMRGYDDEESFDRPTVRIESWSAKGSFENQSVKSVTYEEDDISEVAEELMDWYGEYFEGWEAPDIKDALYGLNGETIPGSDCPIVFTMEESEDEEDWDDEDD